MYNSSENYMFKEKRFDFHLLKTSSRPRLFLFEGGPKTTKKHTHPKPQNNSNAKQNENQKHNTITEKYKQACFNL